MARGLYRHPPQPQPTRMRPWVMPHFGNAETVVDTFDRADQANWGTTSDGLYTWPNAAVSSILSNKGRLTLGASGSASIQIANLAGNQSGYTIWTDVDVKVKWRASNVTSFDNQIRTRFHVGRDDYVRLGYGTSAGGTIAITEKIAGVSTVIASTTGVGLLANTDYWWRVQVEGDQVRIKIWDASAVEPGSWSVTATTKVLQGGSLGVDAFATTAVNLDWDSWNSGYVGINDPVAVDNPMPYIGGGYYA